MEKKYTVFISSTYSDLKEKRQKILNIKGVETTQLTDKGISVMQKLNAIKKQKNKA